MQKFCHCRYRRKVNASNKTWKKVTIIGNGNNLLVTDKGIKGIVLKYINKDYEIKRT